MLKNLTLLFFVLSASLLGGCVSMQLSPKDAKRIHTVHVNEQVEMPKTMSYSTSSAGPILLGGIGAIIQAEASIKPRKRMESFAKQHHIFIYEIVRNQFIKQLSNKTPFKVVKSKNADAMFHLKIVRYGMWGPSISSSHGMDPILKLVATLTNKQNKVIWADQDTIVPLSSGTTAHTAKAIMKNPKLLSKMWNQAAKRAVASIVSTLPKKTA